jgi:hypothetical protein
MPSDYHRRRERVRQRLESARTGKPIPLPICPDCEERPVKSATAKRCIPCTRDVGRRTALSYYYRVRRVRDGVGDGYPTHECKAMADGTCVKCGRTVAET